jgi:2-polyprenyl-3-methyl-5-hydroxy-6-metoxy-1,4-benzoquinol methylase
MSLVENAPKHCILCGNANRFPLFEREPWHVYACCRCGLGFLDPRPSQKDLKNLYNDEYFDQNYDKGADPDTPEFRKMLSLKSSHIRFFRRHKPKGRLLDIGCGYGYFLAACREKGYDVQGLDISDWAVRYATDKLLLPVAVGDPGDHALFQKEFDVITMWHFLEHTPDPHGALRSAKAWLKKDGLLVAEVPNYEGTDARKRWHNWEGWCLPHHLWHFTEKTLTMLLRMHSLRTIRTKDYHSDYVKNRLKRIPVVGLFARNIAKRYSGTGVAILSKHDSESVLK